MSSPTSALSYLLAPSHMYQNPLVAQEELAQHIGKGTANKIDADTQYSNHLLQNAGLNTMMINPTKPTRNLIKEIRKRDSFTSKLVGATTKLPMGNASAPDLEYINHKTNLAHDQRMKQLYFELDNQRFQFDPDDKKTQQAKAETSYIPLGVKFSHAQAKRNLITAYGDSMGELYDRLYHKKPFPYTLEQLKLSRSLNQKIQANQQDPMKPPVCTCGALTQLGIQTRPHMMDCSTAISGYMGGPGFPPGSIMPMPTMNLMDRQFSKPYLGQQMTRSGLQSMFLPQPSQGGQYLGASGSSPNLRLPSNILSHQGSLQHQSTAGTTDLIWNTSGNNNTALNSKSNTLLPPKTLLNLKNDSFFAQEAASMLKNTPNLVDDAFGAGTSANLDHFS